MYHLIGLASKVVIVRARVTLNKVGVCAEGRQYLTVAMPPVEIQWRGLSVRIEVVGQIETTVFSGQVILVRTSRLQRLCFEYINPMGGGSLSARKIRSHVARVCIPGKARDEGGVFPATEVRHVDRKTFEVCDLRGFPDDIDRRIEDHIPRHRGLVNRGAAARQVLVAVSVDIANTE